MKAILISILRDQHTSLVRYREAAEKLAILMAIESGSLFESKEVHIKTPVAEAKGVCCTQRCVLVPILRSGLVLLPAFLQYYPEASVGFLGERREEETAIPELYYKKLPALAPGQRILLLDPMIATGGSATLAVQVLKEAGAHEEQIALVSLFGAPEGIERFKRECPQAALLVAQVDEGLTAQKWITPGLGDFGDRYFVTE